MVLIFYAWENPQICRYLENSNIYVPFTSLKNINWKQMLLSPSHSSPPSPSAWMTLRQSLRCPVPSTDMSVLTALVFMLPQPVAGPKSSALTAPPTHSLCPAYPYCHDPACPLEASGLANSIFLFLLRSGPSLLCLLSSCKVCDAACKYPSHVDNRCPNSKLHHPMLA